MNPLPLPNVLHCAISFAMLPRWAVAPGHDRGAGSPAQYLGGEGNGDSLDGGSSSAQSSGDGKTVMPFIVTLLPPSIMAQ